MSLNDLSVIVMVILGILGGYVTLYTLKDHHRKYWMGVFVAITLTGAAISIQAGRDADRQQEKIEGMHTISMELLAQPDMPAERKARLVQRFKDIKSGVYVPPKSPLKERAQKLSKNILALSGEMEIIRTKRRRSESWIEDDEAISKATAQVMVKYSDLYGAEALAVLQEFEDLGMYYPEGGITFRDPINPIEVKEMGMRIGVLANKLSD